MKFSRKTPHLSITNQLSMIDSAISKRQGDRRKHSLLDRKKILHKRENGVNEAILSSISQNIFSYLKIFSIQCRKNITVEGSNKRMNITIFLNKYTNVYTYM